MKRYKDFSKSERITLWFWVAVLIPTLAVVGLITATACGSFGKLPSFEELENPKSFLATEIISEDGAVLGTYYVENRTYVDYEELSPALVAALTSTEDARFYEHSGIDFISLARVGIKTIVLGDSGQGGGSTITQQLAKNLFKRKDNIVISKLKEWITAVKLERNYTKDEIVAMYFNTVFFGHNAYGVKAASKVFFNKEPHELNVQEAAMLVGVVNAPTRYSPIRNPESAKARRNTVMSRMCEMGYLTKKQLDSLSALPIELKVTSSSHNEGSATYFREMVRQTLTMPKPERRNYYTPYDYEQELKRWETNPIYGWCHKNTKADGSHYDIYRDGLKIYTTINSTMQRYAEEAVQTHMSKEVQPAMDAQIKTTGVTFIDDSNEEQLTSLSEEKINEIINRAMRNTDLYREMKKDGATQQEIEKAFNEPVKMKLFTYNGEIDTLITPRNAILHNKRILRASLMAMDPHTGYVKAYVGGPSLRHFQYDMVKQGKRQVGSTIKPFIYTFAFDHLGFNPCTRVPNLPVSIETTTGEPWTPGESGKVVYDGLMYPLRWGMARSRNNYSAWIMKQANHPQAVADFIHEMGIMSYIDPVNALCLGTPDVSLFEMVGAYSTFANRGIHTEPIFITRIEDRYGNLLAEFSPTSTVAISESTAYTMNGMLRAVVEKGTGVRLGWAYNMYGVEVGGKTGTSQKNRDAWFMCVAPNLVGGAWVGGEDQSVHLTNKGEGSVVALPIYGEFLRKVMNDGTLGVTREDTFHRPAGVKDYDCWEPEEEGFEKPIYVEGEVEESQGSKIIYSDEEEFF